jgi:hypothetical protein
MIFTRWKGILLAITRSTRREKNYVRTWSTAERGEHIHQSSQVKIGVEPRLLHADPHRGLRCGVDDHLWG